YFESRMSLLTPEEIPDRPSYEEFRPEDHFDLGRQYLIRGDFNLAESELERAAGGATDNADYRFYAGFAKCLSAIEKSDFNNVISARWVEQWEDAIKNLQTDCFLNISFSDDEFLSNMKDRKSAQNLKSLLQKQLEGNLRLNFTEGSVAIELFLEAFLLAPEAY